MELNRRLPLITILSLGLMLASCAGLGKPLEPPRVSLADIRVENFTGFETVFRIQLRVINTNDMDLNVKGLEAQLEINESLNRGNDQIKAEVIDLKTGLDEIEGSARSDLGMIKDGEVFFKTVDPAGED